MVTINDCDICKRNIKKSGYGNVKLSSRESDDRYFRYRTKEAAVLAYKLEIEKEIGFKTAILDIVWLIF